MKELKCVKFNVGMYDDIKLKIIDTMEGRDLIHYCLARFIVLAGKVDKGGNLYITKNIPYTIETLSIEFNRNVQDIQLALNALTGLEILELTDKMVFKVKNWAKHQNIKKKCNEDGCEKSNHDNDKINFNEKEVIKENNSSKKIVSKNSTKVLIGKSIYENKSLNKRSKEMLEHISEEEKNKCGDNNKNLVEENLPQDENNILKENPIHSKSNAINEKNIFELKDEINNGFKPNNEKELTISKEIKDKPDKVDLKNKRGRGQAKKSSNSNLKTKSLKKDNSLIKFSCDEYEDDGFNVKDDDFVTFTMG